MNVNKSQLNQFSFMSYSHVSDHIPKKYSQIKQNLIMSNKRAEFYKAELDRTFEKASNSSFDLYALDTNPTIPICKAQSARIPQKEYSPWDFPNQNESDSSSNASNDKNYFYKRKFASTDFAQTQIVQQNMNNRKNIKHPCLNQSLKSKRSSRNDQQVKDQITQTNSEKEPIKCHVSTGPNKPIEKLKPNYKLCSNQIYENNQKESLSKVRQPPPRIQTNIIHNSENINLTDKTNSKSTKPKHDQPNISPNFEGIQEIKNLFRILEDKFMKLQNDVQHNQIAKKRIT